MASHTIKWKSVSRLASKKIPIEKGSRGGKSTLSFLLKQEFLLPNVFTNFFPQDFCFFMPFIIQKISS